MKKVIIVWLFILIAATFISCKKPPQNTSSLSGTENSITEEMTPINENIASSSSKEENSSQTTISSEDKEGVSTAHTHNYYRPQDHYKYIGDGSWDGSGWRDEETRGKVFPTCIEQGFTVYVCSECGHVKYDDYVAATGHQFADKIEYVYPGYNVEGYSYHSCLGAACNEIEVIETYPARQGNLSTIDSAVEYKRASIYDVYTLKGDDLISISDCRTWGNVPTITVNYEEKSLTIEYDLKDGSIDTKTIIFPSKVNPDDEHLHYVGVINPSNTKSGRLEGCYYTRGEWDGNGN